MNPTMQEQQRILIVDDNRSYVEFLVKTISEEGFCCDSTNSADSAIEIVGITRYDLFMIEASVASDSELNLIGRLTEKADGAEAIVIAHSPSVESVVACMKQGATVYLVNLTDRNELLQHVRRSLRYVAAYRAVLEEQSRLQEWYSDLDNISQTLRHGRANESIVIDTFFSLTMRNVVSAMTDLKRLTSALASGGNQEVCEMLYCPRISQIMDHITTTIGVIEKTKASFKSRELGELRSQLQAFVKTMTTDLSDLALK